MLFSESRHISNEYCVDSSKKKFFFEYLFKIVSDDSLEVRAKHVICILFNGEYYIFMGTEKQHLLCPHGCFLNFYAINIQNLMIHIL